MNSLNQPWRALVLAWVFSLCATELQAADPAWWSARGAVNPAIPADDYATLNVGQLKHMAAKARDELDATLPGGAGAAVNALVDGWASTGAADDYSVCNVGQLKAVAQPFYDRLIPEFWVAAYPWTATTGDDDPYAAANLGQLKRVFHFGRDVADTDNDGLLDLWEAQYGPLTLLDGGSHDADNDGLTDQQEFALRFHPTNPDMDGDGLLDGWEQRFRGQGFDPLVANDANLDPDGDGLTNLQESQQGSNPGKVALSDNNNSLVALRIFSPR
jgi:hypothetical protein